MKCLYIAHAVCLQDLWHPFLVFLVPENANADVQLRALESVIRNGNRKKFVYVSKSDLLQLVSILRIIHILLHLSKKIMQYYAVGSGRC